MILEHENLFSFSRLNRFLFIGGITKFEANSINHNILIMDSRLSNIIEKQNVSLHAAWCRSDVATL